MTQRPNAARVGLFVLGGLLLLAAAVVVVFGGGLLSSTEQAVLHFRGSVYGLQVGSPVVLRGVRLGTVRSVGMVYEHNRFRVPVVVELDRERIRTTAGTSAAAEPALALAALVERGLTGQLATQSLLTGQLYIDLDLRPGGMAAQRDAAGRIEIPTTPTRFQSLTDQLDKTDLSRMTADLGAALAATRKLAEDPQVKQTLVEMAQASASLARLAAALEKRAGPLADAAQGTLAQAASASARVGAVANRVGDSVAGATDRLGNAAERLGGAGDRIGLAADRVGNAADRADALFKPDSPLLANASRAADELARAAAGLREATADDGATTQGLQRALGEVSRAARAVRELAEQLDQQPQSLIRGRAPTAP